jgi:hypothetical protein
MLHRLRDFAWQPASVLQIEQQAANSLASSTAVYWASCR